VTVGVAGVALAGFLLHQFVQRRLRLGRIGKCLGLALPCRAYAAPADVHVRALLLNFPELAGFFFDQFKTTHVFAS